MDIHTQVEVVLRGADYETWPWSDGTRAVTCFENQAIAGFVHVFDTCDDLLTGWQESQRVVLSRFAPALRPAGVKAWNVYSVFLTPDPGTPVHVFEVEKIEEDFALTRKIARPNVVVVDDITNALLPLLPARSFTGVLVTDFQAQLQRRLSEVDQRLATAFLNNQSGAEIAALLVESP